MLTVVHAQISSTSRVLRSAWTGVSRGDCIFPFAFDNLALRQKQEEGLLINRRGPALPAAFSNECAYSRTSGRKHHKFVRLSRAETCCERSELSVPEAT